MGIGALLAMAVIGITSPAVGQAATGSWSVVSSPNANEYEDTLSAATCVAVSDCWAVGEGLSLSTLTEHYNGSSWGVVSSPTEVAGQLDGVACASTSNCWSVGRRVSSEPNNPWRALIEHYDRSGWAIASAAPPPGIGSEGLTAGTCVSDTDCWAVGYYEAAGNNITANTKTLIEHYDGNSEGKWSVVSSPNPAGPPGPSQPGESFLRGVSCAGANDCWAVGYTQSGCPGKETKPGDNPLEICVLTLVEHYDGSEWSLVSSPNPRGVEAKAVNTLHSVSCASSSYCVAAGHEGDEGAPATQQPQEYRPLILQNTGSGWSVARDRQPFPHGAGVLAKLASVSCTAGRFCVADGSYTTTTNGGKEQHQHALIAQSTGGGWAVAPSPDASGTGEALLQAVTCTSGCFAVGATGSREPKTLIEQYVGADPTGITVTCSPNPIVARRRTKCTATRVFDAFTGQDILTGALTWGAGSGTFSSSTCTLRKGRRHGGSCSVRFRPTSAGAQTITTTYAGDATHAGEEESTTLQVK
jgi:hypothetical protein